MTSEIVYALKCMVISIQALQFYTFLHVSPFHERIASVDHILNV